MLIKNEATRTLITSQDAVTKIDWRQQLRLNFLK